MLGVLPAMGVALFPKCPMCWTAALSVFGIAGWGHFLNVPWMLPMLIAAMLCNLAFGWHRGRRLGFMAGFYSSAAGAFAILVLSMGLNWTGANVAGLALTLAGTGLNAWNTRSMRSGLSKPAGALIHPSI